MARKLLSKENQQSEARAYIQAAMDKLGIKGSKLASLAEVSPSTITRFMKGEVQHAPEMQTIFAINRVSRVPVPASLFIAYGFDPRMVIEGTPIPADVSVDSEDGLEFTREPVELPAGNGIEISEDLLVRILKRLDGWFPDQNICGNLRPERLAMIIALFYNFLIEAGKIQENEGVEQSPKRDVNDLIATIRTLIKNQGSARGELRSSRNEAH